MNIYFLKLKNEYKTVYSESSLDGTHNLGRTYEHYDKVLVKKTLQLYELEYNWKKEEASFASKIEATKEALKDLDWAVLSPPSEMIITVSAEDAVLKEEKGIPLDSFAEVKEGEWFGVFVRKGMSTRKTFIKGNQMKIDAPVKENRKGYSLRGYAADLLYDSFCTSQIAEEMYNVFSSKEGKEIRNNGKEEEFENSSYANNKVASNSPFAGLDKML